MIANKSKLWYLKQINLFDGMTPDLGVMVEEKTDMQVFEKGEKVYLGVDPAQHIYILKEGRVKLSQEPEGKKELIKAIIYPGEIFGENGLTGAMQYADEATALDRVLVCVMDIKYLKTLMEMHPSLGLAFTASLGMKLARMERKLESLIFKDAHGRILELLMRMADDHGIPDDEEILLQHNLTHQDLANLTATSRQTVTTFLNELRDAGLIRLERKKIFIKDMTNLGLQAAKTA